MKSVTAKFEGAANTGKPQAFAVMDDPHGKTGGSPPAKKENENNQPGAGAMDNAAPPPPRHRLPLADEVPPSSSLWASRRAAFEAPPASPTRADGVAANHRSSTGTAAELAEISRQGQKELRKRQQDQYVELDQKERAARWGERTAAFQTSERSAAFVSDHQRRPLEQRANTGTAAGGGGTAAPSGRGSQHPKPPHRAASMGAVQTKQLSIPVFSQHRTDPSIDEAMRRINRPSLQPSQLEEPSPSQPPHRGGSSSKDDGGLANRTSNIFVQNDSRNKAKVPEMFQRSFGTSSANGASIAVAAGATSPPRKVAFGDVPASEVAASTAAVVGNDSPPRDRQQLQKQLDASAVAVRRAEATAGDLARRLEDALGREDELVSQLTSANEQQELNRERLNSFTQQQEELQATVAQAKEEIKRLRRANKKLEDGAKTRRPGADASSVHSPTGRGDDQYAEILSGHASSAKAAREEAAEAQRRVIDAEEGAAREKEKGQLKVARLEETIREADKEVNFVDTSLFVCAMISSKCLIYTSRVLRLNNRLFRLKLSARNCAFARPRSRTGTRKRRWHSRTSRKGARQRNRKRQGRPTRRARRPRRGKLNRRRVSKRRLTPRKQSLQLSKQQRLPGAQRRRKQIYK